MRQLVNLEDMAALKAGLIKQKMDRILEAHLVVSANMVKRSVPQREKVLRRHCY
jgi:hypothetical protein